MGNTDDPRRIIVTEFRVVFEDELMVIYVDGNDFEKYNLCVLHVI